MGRRDEARIFEGLAHIGKAEELGARLKATGDPREGKWQMKGYDLIRKLVFRAPPDLMTTIYERERLREGPSWDEILRTAEDLGVLTGEEARMLLQYVGGPRRDAA